MHQPSTCATAEAARRRMSDASHSFRLASQSGVMLAGPCPRPKPSLHGRGPKLKSLVSRRSATTQVGSGLQSRRSACPCRSGGWGGKWPDTLRYPRARSSASSQPRRGHARLRNDAPPQICSYLFLPTRAAGVEMLDAALIHSNGSGNSLKSTSSLDSGAQRD